MSPVTGKKPQQVAEILASFLERAGLAGRVEQASVIPEWPELVGTQIAAVTAPMVVTSDGTLFVGVTTNAWMTELSLLEPELLRALNAKPGRSPVRRLRWVLQR